MELSELSTAILEKMPAMIIPTLEDGQLIGSVKRTV